MELREPALPLGSLAPHVADLDPLLVDHPYGAADRQCAVRLVGMDVHLGDGLVAGHEQRVAERLEARVERIEVDD